MNFLKILKNPSEFKKIIFIKLIQDGKMKLLGEAEHKGNRGIMVELSVLPDNNEYKGLYVVGKLFIGSDIAQDLKPLFKGV